jgi:cytochrome c-type biogenesis protein CcmH
MVGLVALLVFWANRDATPSPAAEQPTARVMPDDEAHARLASMSPAGRERAAALLGRLEEEPGDLRARKALTETYVMEGLFFEAFEQSDLLLQQSPGDVDALYFQGLVRMTMGQEEHALELLDQALASAPTFVSARLVRGITRLRVEDRAGALADWQAGLEAAGGTHPGLEQLIRLAESGASIDEILNTPPPGAPPPPPSADATATAPSAPASLDTAYSVRIELPPGAQVPPGATLFVFLRGDDAGPPVAVKRLPARGFPLDLVLDQSDSMLGRPLPDTGTLSARIDSDGSASTRAPEDLGAEIVTQVGEAVVLRLAPGN